MTDDSLANKHVVLYHRYLIFNNSMNKIYKAGLIFYLVWPKMSDWAHQLSGKALTEVKTFPNTSTGPEILTTAVTTTIGGLLFECRSKVLKPI